MLSENSIKENAKQKHSGKAGFKKGDTLSLKSEFDQVRKCGKKFVGRYILLVASPPADGKLRFGIICGRKYSKKAVLRNRARRLIKESFRLLKSRIRPTHCVFIARAAMSGQKMQVIQKDMKRLLKKAELLTESREF